MISHAAIRSGAVGPLAVNCYILFDQDTRDAAIIDPGGEPRQIMEWVKKIDARVLYILNTHGHCDHTGANLALKEQWDVPIGIHEFDAHLLEDPDLSGANVLNLPFTLHKPDFTFVDGEFVDVGGVRLWAIHTPGHSPGSCSFFLWSDGYGRPVLFSGDTLFAGGVGRTDLPTGNQSDLFISLDKLVKCIPEETMVFPGHGPVTSFANERQTNPFILNLQPS